MDKCEEKKLMRREIRARKSMLSEEDKAAAAAMAAARIEALPEYSAAHTVLAYSSMPDELPTSAILDNALAGKTVVLPVVNGDSLELRRYEPEHMRAGYKGILEPSDEAAAVSPSDIDLAIIPGMAFDAEGHRLGRGGGFYDRLIPQLHCPLIGIGFACQMVSKVPVEHFDLPVDIVISG